MQRTQEVASYLRSAFVFHPFIFVTDSVYLTFRYVNAYSGGYILYNKGTKSKEVAKMSTKKYIVSYHKHSYFQLLC